MAELDVNGSSAFVFDAVGLWDKYRSETYDAPTSTTFGFYDDSYLYGVGFKAVKGSAENSLYKLTAGTVQGIYYEGGRGFAGFEIGGLQLAATTVQATLGTGGADLPTRAWSLFLAGDDVVTLSLKADRIVTFAGDDTVYGRSGADYIDGGDGDDNLFGGLGRDTLIGGKGRDFFVFDTKPSVDNRDTIKDFVVTDDKISLDHHIFRQLSVNADPNGGWFKSNSDGRAKDANDYLIFNTSTGDLIYDADGFRTEATPFIIATLSPQIQLTAYNFDIF